MPISDNYRIFSLLLFIFTLAAADSDTRAVQAEFDRCRSVMERLERSLRRYEDAVGRIIKTVKRSDFSGENELRQEASSLENRLEYFRNRIERARGQADKINGDLKPTCTSCVTSSVNMYCRIGETLRNSLDEYLFKAEDLLNRLNERSPGTGSGDFTADHDNIVQLRRSLDSCTAPSAVPLLKQVTVNLQRADSLFTEGNKNDARKALAIARTLAEKAAQRCNDL